jgi:ribose/xylose/arabinose/galactoside ABC-type transport system permease subunit
MKLIESQRPQGKGSAALVRTSRYISVAAVIEYVPYVALVALSIAASLLSSSFLDVQNLLNVAQSSAVLGFVALGSALVLISGAVDLSVGAVMAAGGMACFAVGAPAPAALAIGVAVGVVIGAVNGVLIGLLGANSLIVTLGMGSVVSGALLLISNANPVSTGNSLLLDVGQHSVLGVPFSVVGFLVVLLVLVWWTRLRASGRSVFAVGANVRTSFASGLAVPRTRFLCFVVSGALAALAGIVLAARVNSAYSTIGTTYTFEAITAAVLGGVSLFGGAGSVIRATVGVLVLSLLNNVLNLIGAPIESQLLAQGVLFIAIVALDGLARGRRQP